METALFVSVVIPTYNRSGLLRQTVSSLLAQTYPQDRIEILIVDNNSSDDTWSVIAELEAENSRVRGIREVRRGAHFARNTGALAARGEVLYFTDDDMLADDSLLTHIVEGFAADDKVASVTGKVLPRWDTEPPVWVLEHLKNSLLSLNDLGEALMVTDEDPGIFSCHQAVLRDVFIRAGGFNPDTNAGRFTGDNETGLNIKIRKLGYRFAYVGSSVTHHMIPASRMTQQYLNSRLADQGFCDSYTDYRALHPGKGRLARRILAHSVLSGVSAISSAVKRSLGDSAWRLDLARVYYHRNRVRYDSRLIGREEWREFALRDDWLDEGPQESDAKG